jgi:hypothetical protein
MCEWWRQIVILSFLNEVLVIAKKRCLHGMQNVKREMDGKHTHLDIEGEFLLNNKCSTSVQGALVSFWKVISNSSLKLMLSPWITFF